LNVGEYTSDFEVQHNEVYRVTKYGMGFKAGNGSNCNGLLRNHEIAYNNIHDVAIAFFNSGSVGARVHQNTIHDTTLWNEPASMNNYNDSFAMWLGGYCSDDNDYYDNSIQDVAGMAIFWNGSTQTVTCDASGSCASMAEVGNTIRNTTIDGTCLEKETSPTASSVYGWGSISSTPYSDGSLFLTDNTLTNSRCATSILAVGKNLFYGTGAAWVGPLDMTLTGGSYESGPNAFTPAQNPTYCGAISALGVNQRIVLDDGVVVNNAGPIVPKACITQGTTLVVDDLPNDPFASGGFSDYSTAGGDGTVIECSADAPPSEPECVD
jgi:hypothetical protein